MIPQDIINQLLSLTEKDIHFYLCQFARKITGYTVLEPVMYYYVLPNTELDESYLEKLGFVKLQPGYYIHSREFQNSTGIIRAVTVILRDGNAMIIKLRVIVSNWECN